MTRQKQKGYTSEHLLRDRPDTYAAIVKLSAEKGQLAIADLLGVTHEIVGVVQEREKIAVSIEREARSAQAKRLSVAAFEAVGERISDPVSRKKIAARDLAGIAATANSVAAQLDGDATVRIDVRVSAVPAQAATVDWVSRLRSAKAMGRAGEKMGAETGIVGELSGAGAARTEERDSGGVLPDVLPEDSSI